MNEHPVVGVSKMLQEGDITQWEGDSIEVRKVSDEPVVSLDPKL